METKEERMNIFGTHISCIDLEKGFQKVVNYDFHKPNYICFPSTNLIADAYKDDKLRGIYNNSFITFADGKFTEFYAKLKGYNVRNVSGYWLLDKLLKTECTHYFYGCDDDTLRKLEKNLIAQYPIAKILGFKSPPFIERINETNINNQIIEDFYGINRLNPDFIWIGISSPKQDYLMSQYKKYLNKGIMLGVGAVFDYYAGTVKKSPELIKKLGFRWLWRIITEPVKMYKKKTVPGILNFLVLVLKHDILKMRLNNLD